MKVSVLKILLLFSAITLGISNHGFSQNTGKIKTISAEKFQKKIDKLKDIQLIDVRRPEEYADGFIKGAVNYNVLDSTLINHIPLLDKNKPVFVYCRTGVRGLKAAKILEADGFKVFNLRGGLKNWEGKRLPIVKKQ